MALTHPTSKLGKSLVSVNEACDYYKIDRGTLRRWIATGIITAYRVGPRVIRVDLDSIKAVRLGSGAE